GLSGTVVEVSVAGGRCRVTSRVAPAGTAGTVDLVAELPAERHREFPPGAAVRLVPDLTRARRVTTARRPDPTPR
ncbi:hypothetical protein, partial [Tsukamurella spumae]